jgi:hypothetical protein
MPMPVAGSGLRTASHNADLAIERHRFHSCRSYDLDFNWKTYRQLSRGYHIPLSASIFADLEMSQYRVENGDRICVHRAAALRRGLQGLFMAMAQ